MRTRSITHKLVLALTAAALALPATAPAHAETPRHSVAVTYDDLNLRIEKGQRILARRLDAAAREVCAMDRLTTGSRLPARGAAACYGETRARVAEQFAQLVSNERRGG